MTMSRAKSPRSPKFAEAVRRRRLELRLTQANVAERFGLNQSTVARWERGAIPDRNIFPVVAAFLSLGVGELEELILDVEGVVTLSDVLAEVKKLRTDLADLRLALDSQAQSEGGAC